jgi:outer membrane protein assembly factor BamB
VLALGVAIAAMGAVVVAQEGTPPADGSPRDWPVFRGNPAGTGSMPGPGPAGNPRLLWRFKVGDHQTSSPVVASGIVYVGADEFFALDASTGRQVWRTAITLDSDKDAGAAVAGDTVIVMDGYSDNLVGFEARTGVERWRTEFNWHLNGIPIAAEGIVYAGSFEPSNVICIGICGSPHFSAIDVETGSTKWSVGGIDTARTAVAVADGTLWHVAAGTLHARNAETGDPLWDFDMRAESTSSPAVAGGLVYVGDQTGNLYALDAATGSEHWRFVANGGISSSPTVANGTVVVGTDDNHVHAIDAANGQERW